MAYHQREITLLEFIETSVFHQFVVREFGEENLLALQAQLLDKPTLGPVIQRSGGARKLRWAGKGFGKSGGYRIIYYYTRSEERCYLLLGFKKGELENLSTAQLNRLHDYIKRHLR